MGILKRVVMMLVVDIVFKTATLSPNVKIQIILRILVGMLKREMAVLDIVLTT